MGHRFRKVYLEIGNICNLQCSFCPAVERSGKRLDEAALRDALRQVKPFTDRVTFHLMGEPLSHPDFARFVEIAAEEGTPLELTTNGTLLNPSTEEALLHPIVHQVNFSLQSFSDNFPQANPHRYLEKILAFTQRALNARPDLYINFRLWNLQENDDQDTKNDEILEQVERAFALQVNRRVNPRLRKGKRLTGRLYLHYDTRFEWPSPSAEVLRTKGTCQGTRSHVGIHADGTVVPCCLDKEARLSLGNIFETPFEEILQQPRYQKMKLGFESGVLVEDLCRRCTYSERFQ